MSGSCPRGFASTTGYRKGCRCPECTNASRIAYNRRRKMRKLEAGQEKPSERDHTIARVFARISKEENGCWIWQGAKNSWGYANIRVGGRKGKSWGGHRLLYILLVGELPPGYELHHLCETKACVNPAHLKPVTRKQHHGADGEHPGHISRAKSAYLAKCAAAREARTHCANGHPWVDPISGGKACRQCSRDSWKRRKDRKALVAGDKP